MTIPDDPTTPWIDFKLNPNGDHCTTSSGGLTKREYFAALAMQGLVASTSHDDAPSLATLAEWSVRQGDALIEALNKPVP